MTIETHNWASSAHQEFHKIIREEIFPIVNQVDARVQNFEIQFLKEAAKFVGDFKSLKKEADASLAKYKILELEIERLLKAVDSQDIISVVQNASVVDTSDLQTELERCSKNMTGNLKLLIYFVWMFLGTVRFRNDHVAAILGVDLLKGDRSKNLYTINLHDMASASPICLMARASSTKSWLWHQRLSHLNFDTINDLVKNDLVS
nr:hypothetical protein [Tanacetum cinerariifolium]